MNKEELLKAIEQKQQEVWPTDTGEMAPATVPNNLEQGWLNALTWMEDFINSLPADDIIWYDARRYVIEDNSKEQILCIKEDGLGVVTVGKIVSGTVRWTHLSTLIKHGLLI